MVVTKEYESILTSHPFEDELSRECIEGVDLGRKHGSHQEAAEVIACDPVRVFETVRESGSRAFRLHGSSGGSRRVRRDSDRVRTAARRRAGGVPLSIAQT